jgi:hemolysin activation/secretion protein
MRTMQKDARGSNAYYSVPWGNWTLTGTASQYHYHQEIAGLVQSFVSSGDSRTLDLKAEYLIQRDQLQKNTVAFRTGKYFSAAFVDGVAIDVQHRVNSYAEFSWAHKHYFGDIQLDSSLAYKWGVSEQFNIPLPVAVEAADRYVKPQLQSARDWINQKTMK